MEITQPLPKRTRAHVLEALARHHVEGIFLPAAWTCDRFEDDYGLDMRVEIVANEEVTGLEFSVQLKATDWLDISGDDVLHRCKVSTAQYFLHRHEPVMYVVYDAQGEVAYWLWMQPYLNKLDETKANWRANKTVQIRIPRANQLTSKSISAIDGYVRTWWARYLFRRPSPADTKAISPPVETRVQKLPFNELTWENFERLCVSIVNIDNTFIDCRRYGVRGEKQKGIDLLAERRLDDRVELWSFQCKQRGKFNPRLLRDTLNRIVFKADKYIIIISCDATTVLRDMALERPNTELWDAEDLSRKLKNQYDIIEDFFGMSWRRAFCGDRPAQLVERSSVLIIHGLDALDRHTREELRRENARILNIEPDEIQIMAVQKGTVRVVLELPAPKAEELLSLYRQKDPRLSKVIERFRIVSIEDLEPPSEPPEPGEPGPTEPEGTPVAPISGETEYVCVECGERFTLDKQEKEFYSMSGVGLIPRTLPVRCKRHRQARGQQVTTLGRRNFDIPNADSGQGCFQCFTMADLPEVARWGTTRFPWEQIVPDEPVDPPNVVKFEIDYQVAGVLAIEETDD